MSKNTLHKRRVKLFKKNKGKYWRVNFRSTRHLNALALAAREAGYTPYTELRYGVQYFTLTMYEDGDYASYSHDCGIEATPTV